jgi:subtilisin family serine protease
MEKSLYVMSNRRAGKFLTDEKVASRVAMDAAFNLFQSADVVREEAPDDQTARRITVFEASPEEIAARRAMLPSDTMLEPAIPRWPVEVLPTHLPPVDLKPAYRTIFAAAGAPPAGALPMDAAAADVGFELTVTGDGQPQRDAEVMVYVLRPGNTQATATGVTGEDGRVRFPPLGPGFVAAAVVTPLGGFWTMVVRGPVSGSTVDCVSLPKDAESRAWWYEALGIDAVNNLPRGKGIKVGVVDTGLGPHPFLKHAVGVGAFVGNARINGDAAALDVLNHGTHCSGIIGAKPEGSGGFEGIAPECELYGARVFAPGQPAIQADIAAAIDTLSKERGCHLINLSFGADLPSEIERDVIQDAFERGTLCFAAAGNANGAITYPGAYPETIAVSALGLQGWGPPGTLSSTRLPTRADRFGARGLYLANFSCWGDSLGCAGPGVGIVSTIPDRGGRTGMLGVMDGTSQACPAALATLAVILSRLPEAEYLGMPADETRSRTALAMLQARCRDAGLSPSLQGRGVPFAAALIG